MGFFARAAFLSLRRKLLRMNLLSGRPRPEQSSPSSVRSDMGRWVPSLLVLMTIVRHWHGTEGLVLQQMSCAVVLPQP